MQELVVFFRDGGPFAYLVLVGALTAGLPVLALAVANLFRLRVPTALYALWPVGTALVGLIGTLYGFNLAFDAVAYASPEMQAPLIASGASVSQYTSVLAGIFTVPILVVTAFVAAIARVARGGEGATFTPLHALAPAGLGLVAAGFIGVLASWSAGAVAGAGGLAIALASIRSSPSEVDGPRLASIRLGVAGLGITSALILAWTHQLLARVTLFDVAAHASAEMKQTLLAQVASVTPWPIYGSLAAAAVLLLAGLLAAAPVARQVVSLRSLGHGALFGLLLVPLVGAEVLHGMRLAEARELMRPYAEKRLEALADFGVELPSSTARRPPKLAVTLTVSPEQVWLDGEGLETPMKDGLIPPLTERLVDDADTAKMLGARTGGFDFDGELLLEADQGVTLGQLRPVLASASAANFGRLRLVTTSGTGLAAIDLANLVEPAEDDTNPFPDSRNIPVGTPDVPLEEPVPDRFVELIIEPLEDEGGEPEEEEPAPTIVLSVTPSGGKVTGAAMDALGDVAIPSDATALLGTLKDAYPDEETLVLYGDEGITVGQLVTWLDAVREDPSRSVGGRPGELFPFVEFAIGDPPEAPSPE